MAVHFEQSTLDSKTEGKTSGAMFLSLPHL